MAAISLRDLWWVCRPYTVFSTLLIVFCNLWFAYLCTGDVMPLWQIAIGFFSAFFCNIAISFFNQIQDVETDRINKPHLPLARGAISFFQAYGILWSSIIISLILGFFGGAILVATVATSLLLGLTYSLKVVRYGRFFWVFEIFSIVTVQGVIGNLGYFLYFSGGLAFLAERSIPLEMWLFTVLYVVLSFNLALWKDMPDIEGDRLHGIHTLPVVMGPRLLAFVQKIFIVLMAVTFAALPILSAYAPLSIEPISASIGHFSLLAIILVGVALRNETMASIKKFEILLWKLYFAEYLVFSISFGLAFL